jgi:hypothetical protein
MQMPYPFFIFSFGSYEVSQALKFEVSEASFDRLLTGGASAAFARRSGPLPLCDVQTGGVSVAIVAIAVGTALAFDVSEIDLIVKDRSGIEKV